ncbi:uncharacterized protein BJ212DRAFT_604142 [Suillus subaureus]|uniref:Uncharacterized protein n=1 Tax=Suillus subaureus TaxID=48587 RepID=A0A9P7E273_9AGAM|nr:uncharacterized protein BJ212DRAFT_604142 [Suillus subaureus]KAG1809343.1 hypothetical protein BJ212DRAFT_604142 [Suillus subaureus]
MESRHPTLSCMVKKLSVHRSSVIRLAMMLTATLMWAGTMPGEYLHLFLHADALGCNQSSTDDEDTCSPVFCGDRTRSTSWRANEIAQWYRQRTRSCLWTYSIEGQRYYSVWQ